MIPLSQFAAHMRGLSLEEFLKEVQVPHLVVPWLPRTRDPGLTPERGPQFREHNVGLTPAGDLVLLPLVKRESSASQTITLGRGSQCDIVVPHPAISKIHTSFRETDQGWTIWDANSLNGTKVGGHLVPPEQQQSLRTGSLITLADVVVLEFVEPKELYERVDSLDFLSQPTLREEPVFSPQAETATFGDDTPPQD